MIDPDLEGVQVLALCPTRELAMQAAAEVEKFARYKKGVKVVAVYGGASMEKQIFQLKKGCQLWSSALRAGLWTICAGAPCVWAACGW